MHEEPIRSDYSFDIGFIKKTDIPRITFDNIIMALILAKEFILDYIGIATPLNILICALIMIRLLNPKWKIPCFVYCGIAIIPIILLSVIVTNGSILIGVTNLSRIIQVAIYALFFLYSYIQSGKSFAIYITNTLRPFFTFVLILNCFVMLLQYLRPGFLVAVSNGAIVSQEDMISGLFGYGSTHAVALFTVFVVLINLDAARKNSNLYLLAVIICGASLLIASLNDNKALFFFLPVSVCLRYIMYFGFNYEKSSIKIILSIPFLIVLIAVSIMNIPQLYDFINNNILHSIEIAIRAFGDNAYVNGSDERFKMIPLAFSLPNAWGLGDGIGTADFYEEGYRNFNHFGMSDFGSIAVLCGLVFFFALVFFYVRCFSYPLTVANSQKKGFLLRTVIAVFLIFTAIYTQPFTQVRIAIPTFLICIELAEHWRICNCQYRAREEQV